MVINIKICRAWNCHSWERINLYYQQSTC